MTKQFEFMYEQQLRRINEMTINEATEEHPDRMIGLKTVRAFKGISRVLGAASAIVSDLDSEVKKVPAVAELVKKIGPARDEVKNSWARFNEAIAASPYDHTDRWIDAMENGLSTSQEILALADAAAKADVEEFGDDVKEDLEDTASSLKEVVDVLDVLFQELTF